MSGFFSKFKQGLSRTAAGLGRVMDAVAGKTLDDAFFQDLEEALILADAGVATSWQIVEALRKRTVKEREYTPQAVKEMLAQIIAEMVENPQPQWPEGMFALLIVGVNGVGKTTTIGKLAHLFAQNNQKVVIAAADTFRAAASEQLATWASRAGAQLVKHQEGADPAAVFYDAIAAAKARAAQVVICDTAGRLHNKKHLMDELAKIARVAQNQGIPQKTILVLDATTGQNGLMQARAFAEVAHVDALAVTKLDGTAKGGVVLPVVKELGLPVWFVGVGEGLDDLQPFDAMSFAKGIVGI